MKKILSFIMCLALSGLYGCSQANAQKNNQTEIICTVFSAYDWTREIIGESDKFHVTYLLENGSDMHSYQPTMDDIVKISDCDLFIYIGGESDSWAENKNSNSISLLDALGDSAKTEEIKEGMQSEAEAPESDEHIWLSLGNAEALCSVIADRIISLDPENADTYRNNLSAYCNKLNDLDNQYHENLDNIKNKTLVFGDRFPFRYLVDDYGLDYYAVFSGCSAETEASFETITFIAEKINELGTDKIFTIEGADDSVAKAVISATDSKNQEIVKLNSIQSVTADQIKKGTSYLSIMQSNLDVLKEALS